MNIRISSLFKASLLIAMMMLTALSKADDTDIYFKSATAGAPPIVMFYIEYSPNLTSTICTGVATDGSDIDTTCPAMAKLKLYLSKPTAANPTAADDLADGTIDQFEMTRAALKRVLIELSSMKIGLITAHNSNANCAGPTATGCSNGAEIYQSAVLLSTAVPSSFNAQDPADVAQVLSNDPNKQMIFNKLDRLRSPQGNFTAPNQNKEVYFELYRYLTAKGVYNGHNGWNDFATSSTYNLGDWSTAPGNKGDFDCVAGTDCSSATSGGTYLYNKGAGSYQGDFVETAKNSGIFVSTKPLKWDTTAESGSNYVSPIDTNCQKIFMINVIDGGGLQANDSDAAIAANYSNGGMNLAVDANDPGFVQMARWLYDADLADAGSYTSSLGPISTLNFDGQQNVVSYFVANQPQQVDAAALAGSGGSSNAIALSGNPADVVAAMRKIFLQVLSVSTTFVSASIPVNVFNRSQAIDNAYIALFKADKAAQPQWVGDLKKLKIQLYTVQVPIGTDPTTGQTIYQTQYQAQFVDANNVAAIASDGRIQAGALTFWTNKLGYDLYDNIDTSSEVSSFDGRAVNRGGAGQNIPGFLSSTLNATTKHYEAGPSSWNNATGTRQLYTNDPTDKTLINLDVSNIPVLWKDLIDPTDPAWSSTVDLTKITGDYATDWNLVYSTNPLIWNNTKFTWNLNNESQVLLYFIRGGDSMDLNSNGINTEARRWQMGDPLHSRPLPINYGAHASAAGQYTTTNPDIRILVGSNDGYMRMFSNTNPDGTESGKENWGFMPRELLHMQKRLMDNVAGGNPLHPYGLDGAATVYVVDTDGNGTIDPATDKVWAFFGLRRGGRSYYAMNLTNPDKPVFMWKIDQNKSGFSELGYTFSTPTVRLLKWDTSLTPTVARPVLIFGGGYDMNKDLPGLGTDDKMGNALFVVDAETGDLVWKAVKGISSGKSYINADLLDSIPSDITAYDSNLDGLVDRVYVGDTGGSVWRADLNGTDPNQWSMTKILNVGRHNSATIADDRRFFHAPDVVPARDGLGSYDGVVIGSGNRAAPLSTGTSNYMYLYKDRQTSGSASTTALTQSDLTDVTALNICLQNNSCSPVPNLDNGWKLQLTAVGEKSLATPLTIDNVIYFSTYIPKTTGCGPAEGSGVQYIVSLKDARGVNDFNTTTAGLERSQDTGTGGIPAENKYVALPPPTDNGGGGGGSGGGGGGTPPPPPGCVLKANLTLDCAVRPGYRTYWYEKQ